MKAVVYEKYAPNDDFKSILKVKDVDEPKPKSNEVVFKVKAAALNYNDIWGMRGVPIPVILPHISGSDASGEVIADSHQSRPARFAIPTVRLRRHRPQLAVL